MSVLRRVRGLRLAIGQRLVLTGGLVLLACGSFSLMITSCPRHAPAPQRPPGPAPQRPPGPASNVRVRLADGAEALDVYSFSRGEWFALSTVAGEPASPGLIAGRGPWAVGATDGKVSIDGSRLPASAVVMRPEGSLFRLDGRLYRGSLIVTVDPEGALTAIEVLSLDDYLRGVVTREMSPRWPLEALKAQVVAARTFAAYRVSPSGHARPFLTEFDLAYGGYSAETWIGDRAVKETEGQAMEYEGRLFAAYFSSTCGGATSSAAHVWGEGPFRPLDGAQCDWCRDSPHYTWTLSLKAADLAAVLSEFGVNEVTTLRAAGVDPAGYAKEVVVNGNVTIPVYGFRRVVGSHSFKSIAFQVRKTAVGFEFTGRGWGHGVGLCQWGARGLADEGKGWREILQQYYPGAEIATLGGR